MTQVKLNLSSALGAPLRPFKPEDADAVARLNNMASGGILLSIWERMAETDGDPWDHGRLQQFEQIKSGWNVVVLDKGFGVEAVMMGQSHDDEPASLEGVDAEWVPLMELENLVPDAWCINVIAGLPEYRGQGHGALLREQAQRMARAGGHSRIALVVSDASTPAIRLYERCGYKEFARRPMFKGEWEGPGQDWVLMVKSL